jgi:uncharacterized protein YbjT (DUF2867 family)
MRHTNILVLGGSGFIGRYIVNQLVARGCRVVVPARRRDHAKHLIMLPTCEVVQADIHDDAALDRLLSGQHAVINLVGILQGSEAQFERAHHALAQRVVAACARLKVARLLHMSALGADAKGPSMYQRSKGRGEAAVRASKLHWTVFQPSVVFGVEDRFLNLFAKLAAFAPVLPLAGAEARFQPVWVEDVAQALLRCLEWDDTAGKTYEIAAEADFFLVVLDSTSPTPLFDNRLSDLFSPGHVIVVINKIDQPGSPANLAFIPHARSVAISAKTGLGLEDLRSALIGLADGLAPHTGDDAVAINARHAYALNQAKADLASAQLKLAENAASELVASDLRGALAALGEISGRVDNERMLDALFANFCIGK